MSDRVKIPEDVMIAARKAFIEIDIAIDGGKQLEAVARAILAERERCAGVARRLNGWGSDCGRGGHAEHIAAAIMRGSNT